MSKWTNTACVLATLAAVIAAYASLYGLNKHAEAKYGYTVGEPKLEVQTVEQTVYNPVKPETSQEPETVTLFDVPLKDDLQLFIVQLCEEHHIAPGLVMAMIQKESTYQADKIGDGGKSFGLMQVQPKWHQARMDKHGVTDLLDPYQNVTVGIDYLAELCDRGRGVEWALAAYNAGPTGANNGRGYDYAEKVLSIQEKIEERKVPMFYTDDPVRDAERHQAAQDKELVERPVCGYCTQPIQDEYCFLINDELYCADCLKNYFQVRTEDYAR